jgi:hypothetical protein
MRMFTRSISCVADLTREVDSLVAETNLKWCFRGHTSVSWDLLPRVKREYSGEQEKYFSNEFYVRARRRHSSLPERDDAAGWLALMQHYGLPTRLLDWTRSALIAAFFATEPYQRHMSTPTGTDACIWALAPSRLNVSQGFESYWYPLDANKLRDLIVPAWKGQDTTTKVAAAMAVETDIRMQMQQGCFTVHSSDIPLNQMPDCTDWLRKYVIPVDSLPLMARELEILGFRLGDLFPDLGNVATELRGVHRPASRTQAP